MTARERAIEVMARAYVEFVTHYPRSRLVMPTTAEKAAAMLDALLAATQEQTCPTCRGTAQVESGNCWPGWKPCPDCSSGVVPGTEPLVLLGPERVGWEMCESGAHPGSLYRSEDGHAGLCPDCAPLYRRAGSPDE